MLRSNKQERNRAKLSSPDVFSVGLNSMLGYSVTKTVLNRQDETFRTVSITIRQSPRDSKIFSRGKDSDFTVRVRTEEFTIKVKIELIEQVLNFFTVVG